MHWEYIFDNIGSNSKANFVFTERAKALWGGSSVTCRPFYEESLGLIKASFCVYEADPLYSAKFELQQLPFNCGAIVIGYIRTSYLGPSHNFSLELSNRCEQNAIKYAIELAKRMQYTKLLYTTNDTSKDTKIKALGFKKAVNLNFRNRRTGNLIYGAIFNLIKQEAVEITE